jgi:Tfp pilus assembly protein PilV
MKNKRIHQSSGVTIIEVLFSIGIIVTGLLGVAGLIMVAGTQMTQGLAADAMSNAGLNAIAEFETRNMQNPDNMVWYGPKGSPPQPLFQSPDLYGTDSAGQSIASPSFCIDPYFITQQFSDGKLDTSSYFPGGAPTLKMKRVTLNNYTLPLSREIFIAKDDLAFSTPASGTELPEQQWIREGLNGHTLKRANQAAYSWLAMLTPNRSRANTAAAVPPKLSTSLEPTDHYLLSIVVFKNRVVTNTNDGEQFFEIEFLNGGFGGGEVQLSPTNSDDLYPKHGDWVMLSSGSQIKNFHRWYRITYIEDETRPPDTNPKYYRNATLKGPDWTRPEWHGTGTEKSRATFIPGVIGVFEKTIRLGSARSY